MNGRLILIVDDEPEMRRVPEIALKIMDGLVASRTDWTQLGPSL